MKRLLAMLLALMLWGGSALAEGERYIVEYPDENHHYNTHALLLARDGTALCAPDAYSSIFLLTPEGMEAERSLYGATRFRFPLNADWWADEVSNCMLLMDASGAPLTDFEFYDLAYDEFADRLVFRVCRDEALECGLMDRSGAVLGQWPLRALIPNGEGGYVGWDGEGSVIYLDGDLRLSRTGLVCWDFWSQEGFHDGLMALRLEEGTIYIDTQGRQAFDGVFDEAYPFHGDWACVRSPDEGQYALIDTEGNGMSGRYDEILFSAQDGGYLCVDASGVDFYRPEEGMRATHIPVDASGDWELDCVDHMEGDITDDGLILRMPRWKGIIGIAVEGEGLYAYDTEGRLLFRLEALPQWEYYYQYLTEWTGTPEALILPISEEADVLIDRQGNPVSSAYARLTAPIWRDGRGVFRYTVDDEEGWADSYGVVDEKGRDLLGATYESLDVVDLDRFWVHKYDRWGLIDAEGRWLYEISDYVDLMD